MRTVLSSMRTVRKGMRTVRKGMRTVLLPFRTVHIAAQTVFFSLQTVRIPLAAPPRHSTAGRPLLRQRTGASLPEARHHHHVPPRPRGAGEDRFVPAVAVQVGDPQAANASLLCEIERDLQRLPFHERLSRLLRAGEDDQPSRLDDHEIGNTVAGQVVAIVEVPGLQVPLLAAALDVEAAVAPAEEGLGDDLAAAHA